MSGAIFTFGSAPGTVYNPEMHIQAALVAVNMGTMCIGFSVVEIVYPFKNTILISTIQMILISHLMSALSIK